MVSKTLPSKRILLFPIIVILFTLGFYRNQWRAAGEKWFYDWKTNVDVMLVARLVWSRQESILADGALLGVGDGQWPMTPETGLHQYNTYLEDGKFIQFWTYDSLTGGQGVVFSVIDQLTDFQPGINLKLFRGITSILSALTMTLIVAWFSIEFNRLSAIFVLAFCLLSEWLALYGGSLFFQLWAFYVPAIGVTIFLSQARDKDKIASAQLIGISAVTVIIKTLFNGFEFITPALGMMFVPIVYYSGVRSWGLKAAASLFFKVALGAFAGTILSLAILSFQISTVAGGWREAIQYIAYTYEKRAGGIAENMQADASAVIGRYITEGRALNFGNWLDPGSLWLRGQLEIQYHQLFILFILFSAAFILFSKTYKTLPLYPKTLALLYTTWFSLLPPLSWLILFKAHADSHAHLDYIIWQMPFTLFGFALCGMVLSFLISLRRKRKEILLKTSSAGKDAAGR